MCLSRLQDDRLYGDSVYNDRRIRVQRAVVDVSYHAAYNYWSLRGILAERWAHGPLFGATGESPEQTTLMPPPDVTPPRTIRGSTDCGVPDSSPKGSPIGTRWGRTPKTGSRMCTRCSRRNAP